MSEELISGKYKKEKDPFLEKGKWLLGPDGRSHATSELLEESWRRFISSQKLKYEEWKKDRTEIPATLRAFEGMTPEELERWRDFLNYLLRHFRPPSFFDPFDLNRKLF